jgi:hypothetical protein
MGGFSPTLVRRTVLWFAQADSAGSILFSVIAILVACFLIFRSQLKKAAVGRREMQLFLLGYAVISLCEIFTVGGFPLEGGARRVCLPAYERRV